MAVNIRGTNGNDAFVDADHQINVVTSKDSAKAGATVFFTEKDDGTIIGTRYLSSPEVSEDYRLRVGVDTLLDMETFNYASQNTSKHFYRTTTMTMGLSGGALTTNASSINTTATATSFTTNRTFPLITASSLYCETNASLTNLVAANTIIEYGLFLQNTANPYNNVDGVSFRWTSAGLFGVLNNNGTELTTSAFAFSPIINRNYHYIISVTQQAIEFWIDNVLYGEIEVPVGNGQPCLSGAVPFTIRHAHVGGAAGAVVQLKTTSYSVSMSDLNYEKPWNHQVVGMGGNSSQGYSGMTQANTAVIPANAAAVATTVPSATAATANGLGGKTQWALTASAITDFILFSWQVPAASSVVTGRSLYISGLRITSAVTTALVAPTAGNPLISYDLGYGSTAVTLATTESTSFAATTKIARKIPLGFQGFTTTAPVIGTMANDIVVTFQNPIVINPGEWFHIVERCVNAAAGGLLMTNVQVDGYFE